MLSRIDNNEIDAKELMMLAKDGDSEAFGLLYNKYFVPVFRYIYLRLKSKEEAEDLAQTVFIRVYKSLPRWRDQGKEPLAYFFTIARNAIIDYWRKKKDWKLDDNEEDERNDGPVVNNEHERIADRCDNAELVKNALSQLDDVRREVIVLRFMEGFSNKEIAELLGKSEEAIRQIQCRALKFLRDKFKDLNLYEK
ncbi:MAG: RNA polymerase sigma factor [Patescibacteria group bacterium]